MFVTITAIFLYKFCVYSLLKDNINLRADCYRSFSDPIIFIKLLHYYPSGPLALTAIFSYKRYYLVGFTPETVTGQYDFSRYDFPCNTSTLFTTGGFFFSHMFVDIKIYLLRQKHLITHTKYIFSRGFKHGEYKLLDHNLNFAVQLKIIDTKEKYLESQRKLNKIFQHYVENISDKKGELCIVTINNRANVVKFKEGTVLPGGYITAFSAHDYQRIAGKKYIKYSAFLCQTHEKYYEEKVTFIKEKNKMGKSFDITYLHSFINDEAHFTSLEIGFRNPAFESIDNLENIPALYNKIFIFSFFNGPISKNCSDGFQLIPLLNDDNVEFSTCVRKVVEITTGVKVFASLITSPSNLCGEE